ncbi:MAG TPA: choice-of-anchor J domain-containing protein [Planctomycetota bacterium]|nr:choice-of-anchor J domain-containing protein [Planctomycetota bacterium]
MFARCTLSLLLPALLGAAQDLHAQASFVESFDSVGTVSSGQDGPAGLIAKGWIFRNQSAPKGAKGWYSGAYFTPQAGAGYLGSDSLATDFFGGDISLWALLPAVPGQVAGDTLTLHVRAETSSNHDVLQLRYSPGGGTGTGSTATSVGDFTTLLQVLDPMPTGGWATVAVPVPGAGRLALRWVVEDACNFGCFSSQVGVDTLSIGPPPPPPCHLPPAAVAGQTVTWPAAGGPYEICTDVLIPVGATVVVQPGTSLVVDDGVTLGVGGTLIAHGTPGAPISISGGISLITPPLRVSGTADLAQVDYTGRLHAAHGGSLLIAESSFPGGFVSTQDLVGGSDHGTYVQVDGCDFGSGGLSVTDGTLVVRDSQLVGSALSVLRGWLLVDDVSLQGAGLSLVRERYTQPAWIDGVSVGGFNGPALDLSGWDFLLGPGNVLTGNLQPVRLRGGLLAGSVVPPGGNTQNIVNAQDMGVVGRAHWAELAVPYVVGGSVQTAGNLTLEPGALVRFGSGAKPVFLSAFRALGLPGHPVRFQRNQPGSAWGGLAFLSDVFGPRFEHCELDGATLGVQADDGIVHVGSVLFAHCTEGTVATTFGDLFVRKSRYLDNGTGVRTTSTGSADLAGTTGANTFDGNTTGVLSGGSTIPATGNWWGDPSGPTSPNNPGGQGDSASFAVSVKPFLTAPPDDGDSPPVVRLARSNHLIEDGRKVIFHWDAQDDGHIVSQRIEYSPHGNWTSFFLPVASGLPGTQRSFEWTVPVVLPSSNTTPTWFRVIATDDAGQEGFDEAFSGVPYTKDLPQPTLSFLTDLSGPFSFGDEIDVCWDYSGLSGTFEVNLLNDADLDAVEYGGGTTLIDCWDVRMPYVSTDTARIAITFTLGAGGRTATFISQRFTIRPDARVPDAPPAVTLLAPVDGTSVAGGSTLPVSWTASDAEGLRSLALQASYDGGRTWHMIVEGLPPSTTSYAWTLPTSTGIPHARLRVVANDLRFQSTSDEAGLHVLPGSGPACQTDLGFGGPGSLALSVCGDALASGSSATLRLTGAKPAAAGALLASLSVNPTPFKGGLLVTVPVQFLAPIVVDGTGHLALQVPGGFGPADVAVQAVLADASQPKGFALSNAVMLEFLL